MVDVKSRSRHVMHYFGTASTKLVEFFRDNPLSVPSEGHATDPSPNIHDLSGGVERGNHREAREEPGLWRQSPDRCHPLEARDTDENDRKEKRRGEFVPKEFP